MKSSETLAIAFDIGTTTISASLIDTATGERLAHAGALNPQREFGADVVLRLQAACESEAKLLRMSQLVGDETLRLAHELLAHAGKDIRHISGVALAGNPAMEHLLLGLPVRSLAFPPHRPSFKDGMTVSTTRFGWEFDTNAYLFPLPGGFVGGDLVAFLYGALAEGLNGAPISPHALPLTPANSLFLDLGTNAEIALSAEGRIFATSAAAGPAFEGGNLACGMAALPGAINRVVFTGDKIGFSVIGSGAPKGICGSAVIDTVAGLLEAGVVDTTGRLLPMGEIPTNLGNRIAEIEGEPVFTLYMDSSRRIYLSQQDIREVQSAKAAIRAGMEILLRRADVSADQVRRVVLTGSFGSELCASALKSIGILSEKMVHITDFVHEGVLAGMEKALCLREGTGGIERFSRLIRVIPLSGTPAFERLFIEQMDFPVIS